MNLSQTTPIKFACDAMLGGVAKWLRAYGYDTFWEYGISDERLINIAQKNNMILLTSDSKIMERKKIKNGTIKALYIPHGLKRDEQIGYVIRHFKLKRREPRCMACGGMIIEISKEDVAGKIPPKTYAWLDTFMECQRCGKLLWEGTHWQKIISRLDKIVLLK